MVVTETWHGTITDTAGQAMDITGAYPAVWERVADGRKILAENNSYPMPAPQPALAKKRHQPAGPAPAQCLVMLTPSWPSSSDAFCWMPAPLNLMSPPTGAMNRLA